MSGYFKDIITGLKSLAVGLQITNKEFLTKPITLLYPHESVKMYPRYRGHIELIKDPETGMNRCICCGMCEKGCPSGSITVKSEKRPGVKGKVLTAYILNFTTCSLCGQCVENCKPEAIRFSNEYNLASTRREDYIFNLLEKLHPEGIPEPEVDPELLKKELEKEEAAKKAAAAKKEAAAKQEAVKKEPAKEGGESKAEEKS
ncbi:MAG: NADH-quinone oxidoreductase subunit I [Proteobacteria bacterium]|nr:NADH-quinone oxidoreductase subunit I [Pseudomonadota bacterium]MBU4296814.1 NADH-quinone oxidoreductase subunit I [Pseudomonadota bacterium]MCG2749005.1 NADH-quinone oxidoreductase subunit I [Desulfobulbaceae bacterium]